MKIPKNLSPMAVALLALLAALFVLSASSADRHRSGQPIQFNHKLHTEDVGLECTDCHRYVKTEEFAGRPVVEICAECHDTPQTESPEEKILHDYIEKDQEIPWVRLYDVPSHVYYSHRRHVTVAKLACSECHGDIGQTTSPPRKALKKLSMKFCIACHERRGISTDCNDCHR